MNKVGATNLILAGILVAALGLRLWGISFGLPYNYHIDERFYINTALALGDGVLNNPPYNPTGLSNILFLEFAAYYLVGKVMGVFSSPKTFELFFRSDPTIFYLLARLTVLLFGAATTLALYLLGRASSGSKVGLMAAGFLAVNFLYVRDSHYAVPDIAMAFFVVLAVGLAATGLRHTRRRDIYLAGLAGGLAVAMKWTAFPVVAAVWWASVSEGYQEHKGVFGKLVNRTIILAMLALAIGFALGSFPILLNPAPYLGLAKELPQVGNGDNLSLTSPAVLNRWLFYGKSLFYGTGIILVVLSILGTIRRLTKVVKTSDPMSILLLSFPLIYSLLIATTGYYFVRYMLPLVPFIVLFAAEASLILWTSMGRVRWGKALLIMMVLAAISQPLAYSIRHDLLLTREDTRTLAKEWIEASIPEGSKIALDWQTHGPPLSTLEKTMPGSEKVYDVYVIGGMGLSIHPLAWYEEQGFDYLIVSSFIYRMWIEGIDAPSGNAFYTSLDNHCTLVQTFRSYEGDSEPPYIFDEMYGPLISLWQRVRPGPTLKIYKIQSGG